MAIIRCWKFFATPLIDLFFCWQTTKRCPEILVVDLTKWLYLFNVIILYQQQHISLTRLSNYSHSLKKFPRSNTSITWWNGYRYTGQNLAQGISFHLLIWLKNGAIKTFVKGLFAPDLNIVGVALSLIHQLPI